MASIQTNNSAIVALQNLRSVNRNLAAVQEQISTGKKISNAKDNASIYAISTVIKSDVEGFKKISDSLNLGSSTVAVARGAAEQVTDILTQIKGLIVQAQESNVDRAKIQADIGQLTDQVDSIVNAAQFNGLNLVKAATGTVTFLASLDRDSSGTVTASSITVAAQSLETGTGGGLAALASIDVSTAAGAASALTSIEALVQTAIDAAAAFGSAQKRIEVQNEFVRQLTDALTSGVGALTDADLEEASARLQSLQVQQQLGIQALSIANQSPQSILALFR
ncbi:MAG: flagellin [Parvularculaceae bacterium]